MSIEGAAKELTKEIERLTKEAERLTKVRDSLVPNSVSGDSGDVRTVVRKSGKKAAAGKPAAKKAPGPKKRALSRAGRKAISDAAKRMWAEKKKKAAAAK